MLVRRSILVLCLAIAALSFAIPAHATWSRDPGANLLIDPLVGGTDNTPELIPDGSGGTIVTWFDHRNGNFDICAQHVNNKGVALWGATGVVVCSDASDQTYPSAVPDGAGGAIITWHDLRSGGFDLYAQRLNAAGVRQWAANGVAVCAATLGQYHLATVSDGRGGMIATWLDERNGDGGDIYAQRLNGAGLPQWPANGVAVCTAAGIQQVPMPVADGNGGAIIVWTDARSGVSSVYAQRVSAAGAPQWAANGVFLVQNGAQTSIVEDGAGGAIVAWEDTNIGFRINAQRVNGSGVVQWSAGGVQVCPAATQQTRPRAVADGAGGAIVTWADARNAISTSRPDVYVQKVSAAGALQWAVNGVALSVAQGVQQLPEIASDGAGGAIVAWQDTRGINYDISARRITSAGVPQWATDGMVVCNAGNVQASPALIPDGRGGVIVAWYDFRNGASYSLYAQRIDGFGLLGDPAPEIVAARDLPNDQGGHVRIKWNASYRDTFPTLEVSAYGVWRQVTAAAAAAILAHGGEARSAGPSAARPSELRTVTAGAQVTYWEGVGSVLARGEPWYTFVADTFVDSTSAANPNTVYMIDVHDATPPRFWSSVPDSGYSVDNLPPAAPAPFTGQYTGGVAHLDWAANPENDLAGYHVYRGNTYGFIPSPGNQVATLTGVHLDDPAPSGSFYRLSAIDVHGNESAFTALAFSTTGAPGGTPTALTLSRPTPNPAREGASLHFALPQRANVSLAVYDAGGRLVRHLAQGAREAGEYVLAWDLRDDQGQGVATGLYWVRLQAGGRTLTQRLVRIR